MIYRSLLLACALAAMAGCQPTTTPTGTPSASPVPTPSATPIPSGPTGLPPQATPTPALPTPAPTPDTSVISTVAGIGVAEFSPDADSAKDAKLDRPVGLAFDQNGLLVFAESESNRIRQITATGGLTTLAGGPGEGFAGDDGPAGAAKLAKPIAVACDKGGSFYIADWANRRIRKVDGVTHQITTFAGMGNGTYDPSQTSAKRAALTNPYGVAVDLSLNVYIADTGNHVIRKVSADGTISTLAGSGVGGFSGDGGKGIEATLRYPKGVAVDNQGNVYIADTSNNRVRRIDASGRITTLAGNGQAGFSGDGGMATEATLNEPYGIAVDRNGNVYVSEPANYRIRRISPDGRITTVAGNGLGYYSGSGYDLGEGGPATKASLAGPTGLAVDGAGTLYVTDVRGEFDHRIRKIVFPH